MTPQAVTSGARPPLRLFWWKARPNFGDELSPLVVAHMSGRRVQHAGPRMCDMLALGSMLQAMSRNLAQPAPGGNRPVIWGAGLIRPASNGFLENVDIALLRGPVTAALLGLESRRFGDPGLLVPDVFQPADSRLDRIGLVPHHTMMGDPALAELAARHPVLRLIDPTAAAETVCAAISECRHVISASLHGLIVADAYGVPSTWLEPTGQSHLKYLDYAASVGRPLVAPVALADVPARLASLPQPDRLPYADGLERAVADLKTSFPAHLCASQNETPAAARA